MSEKSKQTHFIWLTISLAGLLLTWAFTQQYPDNITLNMLQYSSVVLMLVALKSLRKNRSWLIGWITIIAITLMSVVARSTTNDPNYGYIYLSILLLFFISAAWLVGSQVLLTGTVDANKITGSIALYLLLGLIWAIFYTLLLGLWPESMIGVEPGHWNDHLFIMAYFSFVTLTTLGYGDISPATPIAQVVVILEAISGMFYLAIIVASLIASSRYKGGQS